MYLLCWSRHVVPSTCKGMLKGSDVSIFRQMHAIVLTFTMYNFILLTGSWHVVNLAVLCIALLALSPSYIIHHDQ